MQQLEQRINLYQRPVRGQGRPFSAESSLKLLGIAAAAMVLIQVYGAIRLLIDESQYGQVRRQVELLEAQTDKLEKQTLRPRNRLLESRIEALRQKIGQNKRMFALLQQVREEPPADLQDYLRGLAARTPNGVWLTHILIDAEQGVDLRGGVTDPALAPAFVRSLEAVPVFQGIAFGKVELGRAPGQGYVGFRLSSTGMGEAKQ
ncbi:MAG: PilN domain-containing protein [Gammaproteobacteria bacterium]|nr:PilN domain-containing protein [Gammaproteobacteria bacterium]MBU1655456.1 PilN domain-containing protein [Gammaproteobacteria bacterium]MBU1962423.1 PilN domain-containing protein [Gammaproteobacteria bacterium]